MAHHGTLSCGEQVLECFFCASDFYGENGWNECRLLFHICICFLLFYLASFFFSADTIPQAMQRIGGLFGAGKLPVISVQSVYYLRSYGLLLIFAAIAATPLPVTAFNRFMKQRQEVFLIG